MIASIAEMAHEAEVQAPCRPRSPCDERPVRLVSASSPEARGHPTMAPLARTDHRLIHRRSAP
jgi:hypothetical protein